MKVYQAIASVQGELAKVGIAKANRNSQQGYNFRGIDDVYAALSPLLAKHSLVVIPRCLERIVAERVNSKGNPLFYITVKAEFDFVSAEDGSVHTACTYGEAMDSADKATNKAMSAAYKYAAFMTFAIPTEGDNDADATTHEVASTISQEQFTELQSLMDRSATTAEKICEGYKIDAVALLPAKSFPALKARLSKIADEMEKVAA